MLAASCRVCVACKAPVDYSLIGRREEVGPSISINAAASVAPEPARFSWGIFFAVLLIYFSLASLCQAWVGIRTSYYVMGGFVLATSVWVFMDAREKGLPRPAGWALGCVLLWIVIFPWYISRRRTPDAPCPIMEGEAGPVTRAIILFLVIVTIAGVVMMFVTGDFPLQEKNAVRPEENTPTSPAPRPKPDTHRSQP